MDVALYVPELLLLVVWEPGSLCDQGLLRLVVLLETSGRIQVLISLGHQGVGRRIVHETRIVSSRRRELQRQPVLRIWVVVDPGKIPDLRDIGAIDLGDQRIEVNK